jgi:hypothetical protein
MAYSQLIMTSFDNVPGLTEFVSFFPGTTRYGTDTGRFSGKAGVLDFTSDANVWPPTNRWDTNQLPNDYVKGAIVFAVAFSQNPNQGLIYWQVGDGAIGCQLTLKIDANGQVWAVYRGTNTGTILASGTSSEIPNMGGLTYVPIQFGWLIDPSVGRLFLRINGKVLLDGTTNYNTQNTANTRWNRITYCKNSESFQSYPRIDDFALYDLNTDPFNILPRDGRVYVGVPTADDSVQWTPNSGSNNFSRVNSYDGDTSYTSSSTVGQEDRFTLSSTWIPNGSTIFGYPQVLRYARIDDATPREVASLIRSGASTAYSTPKAEFSNYTLTYDKFLTNPNGGGAWDLASLQAIKIGYKLTGP